MSQYIAPPNTSSVETLIREVHQQQWLMSERLFGNGQPGEIDNLHSRISAIKEDGIKYREENRIEISELKLWQAEQGGASAVFRSWLMPIVGLAIAGFSLFFSLHK